MKKLLLPFLTEWLIKHGTNVMSIDHMTTPNLELYYKAIRKGYIVEVQAKSGAGNPVLLKLSKEGIQFLQENQK